MLTGMGNEYWYVTLPTPGAKRLRGETATDQMNRELNELVERGWEPISVASSAPGMQIGVMLRKAAR